MQKLLFIIALQLAIMSVGYSQSQNQKASITLKDGTEFSASIDLEAFEKNGSINVRFEDGSAKSLNPKEVNDIKLNSQDRRIKSGSVTYLDKNLESKQGWFFLEVLVDGDVSLFRNYTRDFKNVLGYLGNFKALQRYYVDAILNKDYQGTFYIAFQSCIEKINVYDIKFSEGNFIDVVNDYNNCVSPEYIAQSEDKIVISESEIEFQIGSSNAHLNIVEDNNEFEESSESYFQLNFKRSILDRKLYFTSGLSRHRFVWKAKNRNNRIAGFTEIRIPVNIEARTELEIIDIRAYTGFNITGLFTNIDTNGYVSYNLGGSVGLNLMNGTNIGVNLNRVFRHRALQNRDNNFEYKVLNEYTIGFFVRKKLFFYE